ncbi:MAG TPA: hypothetical protein VK990_09765 [Acidimicrobiia bacterium]|nr:hypothetical protein [Acidimicrobiia bacterium]
MLSVKGVNYDVGTRYRPDEISRPTWTESGVAHDLAAIRSQLHCSDVNLYGTDLGRLEEGGRLALREGLRVSIQPRAIDRDREQALGIVEEGARIAERLRADGEVTLNTGCEMSLFTRGFLPGRTFMSRMRSLTWAWPFLPAVSSRLNRHLLEVASAARRHFGGPITYGAGTWESVDWSPFDLVGVNLYRDRWNEKSYLGDLRKLFQWGKPVLVTEFGCSAFEGAERLGGGGWTIVDFDHDPPRLKPGHRRSEQTQASYIAELLGIFVEEGVTGAYVFDFVQPSFPHDPDPALDLDMAGYGLVKVIGDASEDAPHRWERKKAFDIVARVYGAGEV